ncbi:hypothetical protein DRO24_05195 [Candidatus Bathyarchaeota archaeon]|nr:MAG: hypothetical protein DRO24_05195 [Candidatus Bathyarchaeota archaeon]
MKIAYYSVAPFVSSGFGVCTRYLAYHLAKKHEVDIFSYFGYEGVEIPFMIEDREVKIIGGNGTLVHPVFFERYHEYDVQILHFDGWVISKQIASLKDANIIHWCILDHDPLQRAYIPMMRSEGVKLLVPMTNWGKKILEKSKYVPKHKITEPIPHGADPDIYFPEKNPQVDFLPDDVDFLIVAVVDNYGIRENVPEILEAFAIFLSETHTNAFLYMHTEPIKYGGYNLYEVMNAIEDKYGVDISDKVMFKVAKTYLPSEIMRRIYCKADCLINTVKGGSFEIPLIEAGLCETPVIATDWGATGELLGETQILITEKVALKERGIGVRPSAFMWMNRTSSRQAVLNVYDIADALWFCYNYPDKAKKTAKNMRKWVLENATWEIVGEKWLKLLDDIEENGFPEQKDIEVVSNI